MYQIKHIFSHVNYIAWKRSSYQNVLWLPIAAKRIPERLELFPGPKTVTSGCHKKILVIIQKSFFFFLFLLLGSSCKQKIQLWNNLKGVNQQSKTSKAKERGTSWPGMPEYTDQWDARKHQRCIRNKPRWARWAENTWLEGLGLWRSGPMGKSLTRILK